MSQGTRKCEAMGCKNLVTENKIFCHYCLSLVTPEARKNWLLAFPYDVPYDVAMKPNHEDQRKAIERMRENITFAKKQKSLF